MAISEDGAGGEQLSGDVRITMFTRSPRSGFSIEGVYASVRAALPPDCDATVWACRHPSSGIWRRLSDSVEAARHQGDVNHVLGDVHYLTYLLNRRRTILTVHDLVSLQRLRGMKRFVLWLLWYWLPVRRAAAIVVVSESTRTDLLASVRCDASSVHVIHNPVSPLFTPVSKEFNRNCPRILQVGTNPNKNLRRVAEALSNITCRLVIIGKLSPKDKKVLDKYRIDYENYVDLSEEAVVDQYALADLVLFASTYEGFGLPIVEANAVGRAVVTSNVFSMPEVAADAAAMVDPTSVDSIRREVLRVIDDSGYRAALIEAGFRNVERFRAAIIAGRYATLYRKIAADSGRGRNP